MYMYTRQRKIKLAAIMRKLQKGIGYQALQ